MKYPWRLVIGVGTLLLASPVISRAAEPPTLRERVLEGLQRATRYFRKEVATEGGYLWRYSEDLKRREGENRATATMVWVQPPGTPSVGLAYLGAFQATGDESYRDAARETALALVNGQLRSGGWDYQIEFHPRLRPRYAYRVDPAPDPKTGSERKPGEPARQRQRQMNTSTLDDNTTQEALRLLMRVDAVLDFHDRAIHEAAEYALSRLIDAQYPNGAWPQRFTGPPLPEKYPVKKASYPESWSRTFPNVDYHGYYTLNDNAMGDMIDIMLEAARVYNAERYRNAARRGGDFLVMAQMPEPQPAWAQQYDLDMHPAWARKFEPPSITGGESQTAMRALLNLALQTRDEKYLEPIPRALEYLRRSRLPAGNRLARFYELQTNKPLYFTKSYELTYSDADMPTHYAFKIADNLERIAREYNDVRARIQAPAVPDEPKSRPKPTRALTDQATAILKQLDPQGRWVTEGILRTQPAPGAGRERMIDTAVFVRNVQVLSNYLLATRP